MSPEGPNGPGWSVLSRLPMDSPARAIIVALLVCSVCAALIATAVHFLAPYQKQNRERQRSARVQETIGAVPGLADVIGAASEAQVEARLVELETGSYVEHPDPSRFDPEAAARDAATGSRLPPERDLAGIGWRAHHATVFLVVGASRELRLLILPVYGTGYASTLRGFLALDADLDTVRGLTFYEHGETPGMGAEIEDATWLAKWPGKRLRDDRGNLRIGVRRPDTSSTGDAARYEVDGISGATRTGIGITNLLRFWLGPDGFGPYLQRLEREGTAS